MLITLSYSRLLCKLPHYLQKGNNNPYKNNGDQLLVGLHELFK